LLGVGLETDTDNNKSTEVYEKFNPMLHSGVTITVGRGAHRRTEVLSIPFIKKYIAYAKREKPVLTKGAADHIVGEYSALRNDELDSGKRRTSPITARTLETLIRLATAHAKARLSKRVEQKDAEIASQILRFALFKEVVEPERRKRRRVTRDPDAMSTDNDSSDDSDDDGDERETTTTGRTSGRNTRSQGTATQTPANDEEEEEEEDEEEPSTATPRTQRTTKTSSSRPAASSSQFSAASSRPASQLPATQTDSQDSQGITPQRLQLFQNTLGQLIDGPLFANDAADVEPLVAAVNARLGSGSGREPFGEGEATRALEELSERNKVMFSDGIVYKI
jgi:DNA replication licensing factor MCM3